MQNITFRSLTILSLISSSPLYSLNYNSYKKSTVVFNSHFSRSYSNFIYACTNFHSTKIKSNIFTKFLQTPLKFSEEYSFGYCNSDSSCCVKTDYIYENGTVIKDLNITRDDFPPEFVDRHVFFVYQCGDIRITNCIFWKCFSILSSGGAILVEQDCFFELHGCIFEHCYSTLHGGALAVAKTIKFDILDDPAHLKTRLVIIQYNCFNDCFLDNPHGFGSTMIIGSNIALISYSTTFNNFHEDQIDWGATYDLFGDIITTKNINCSFGNSYYCGGIEYRNTRYANFQFNTLSNISGKYVMAFNIKDKISNESISWCNIIRNKIYPRTGDDRYSSFIFFRYSSLVIRFFFFSDNQCEGYGYLAYKLDELEDIYNQIYFVNCSCFDGDHIIYDLPYIYLYDSYFNYDYYEIPNNTIGHLNLGECIGKYPVEPGPFHITNTFTATLTFTFSDVFSNSQIFTASSEFSPSSIFTASLHFGQSHYFTPSHSFTPSDVFSYSSFFNQTDSFSGSEKFSNSKYFSKSKYFTKSCIFSWSKIFEPTDVFSNSNSFSYSSKFTYSDHFSNSKYFSKSKFFSKSNIFSGSQVFEPTDVFSESKSFNPTNFFTKSDIFSQSDVFAPTEKFSPSIFFSSSHQFSQSEIFNQSSKFSSSFAFSNSNVFSQSLSLNWTGTFTPSSTFTQSSIFTLSLHFSESFDFTDSESLRATPTPSIAGQVLSYMKSVSQSFLLIKSVSMSVSQVLSQIVSLTYFKELGGYSNIAIVTNVDQLFPYVIQFYSPTFIEVVTLTEIHRDKKKLTHEQLIGIICGSVGVFFGIAGIIILSQKKKISRNSSFDLEYSSDEEILSHTNTNTNTVEITNEKQVNFDLPQTILDDFDNWL